MKIKSLIGTSFVFYLILMIGFNEPAHAAIFWNSQNSGTGSSLNAVEAVDANTAWAVGQSGTIRKTTDGGATWVGQSSANGNAIKGVSVVDANTAWAVGSAGTIQKTIDGGATWSLQTSGTTENLNDVSAVDASTAWAVGELGALLYTTDGGTTWSPQTNPVSGSTGIGRVSAVDASTAWAAIFSGGIKLIYTDDGGATWVDQTPSPGEPVSDVSAVDANTAWLVGLNGVIRYTTNAGATWGLQTSGTTVFLTGVSAVDASTAWAVGQSDTILHTTDAGATWSAQTAANSGTGDVSAVDANTAWAVGFTNIQKGVETVALLVDVTIQGVCEVDLASGAFSFTAGDPISNGAGVGTGEVSEVMTNTLGNLQSQTSVYGTDWTDGGATTIMDGSHTVVSTASGAFGSKTGLSTNSVSPTALANIAPQGSITSYWDVEIVMDGSNPGYSGATTQTITVDFNCI